jgi:hypothetical protein
VSAFFPEIRGCRKKPKDTFVLLEKEALFTRFLPAAFKFYF